MPKSDGVIFGQICVTRFVFDHDSRRLLGYAMLFASLIDRLEKTIDQVYKVRHQAIQDKTKQTCYHHNHCSPFPWCCQLREHRIDFAS